jgi:hypothetical protein
MLWEHHVIIPTYFQRIQREIFAELQIPQKSEIGRKLRNNKIIENFLSWHL